LFTVLGKFPEFLGLADYYRLRGRALRLIEYK
jgi:hypothetical protein